jgi:hypothetical protein
MNIASIVYHAQGRLRLGVKSTYQKRDAISGRKGRRPEIFCERCGKCAICHLHHRDYNKPELVMWVCPSCHATQQAEDRANGMDCRLDGRWVKGNPQHAKKKQKCSDIVKTDNQLLELTRKTPVLKRGKLGLTRYR